MNNNVVSKYKYENYLLVEGDDDKHLFDHLLGHHQIFELCRVQNEDLQVKDKGGFENLAKTLKTELKRSGLRRLGIIVDANDKILYRWQSLQDRLIEFSYSKAVIPPVPSIGGTIIEQENLPMVGLWLMPDNQRPGIIEDFVSLLIQPNDLLWPMAIDIVQRVIEKDCRFRESYTSKARIHSWLAWQEEPGKPMGQAITKHYLDAEAPHAQEVIGWIRRLFDLGSA